MLTIDTDTLIDFLFKDLDFVLAMREKDIVDFSEMRERIHFEVEEVRSKNALEGRGIINLNFYGLSVNRSRGSKSGNRNHAILMFEIVFTDKTMKSIVAPHSYDHDM